MSDFVDTGGSAANGAVSKGAIVGGRFQVGELISVQGKDGCRDVRCSRIGDRCFGHHCARCGEPTSMYGHFTHVAWWERAAWPDGPRAVKFPDGAGYFSCSPEFEAAVAELRAEVARDA